MATIPETDMTVLWLQLGAPGRTPVLCMRCDNKGHCLLKAAKNLALSEGVSSRPVEIDFRLHQEIFEALHGQQNSIWHVGNGYGCIASAKEEFVLLALQAIRSHDVGRLCCLSR